MHSSTVHLQHNRYYVVEPSGDGRKSDMSKGKELTGQRFGKLTAVEATDERKNGYIVWRCRCDCGKEIYLSSKQLAAGKIRDCGCTLGKNARRGSIAEDLTGQVFGSLTVVRRAENMRGRTSWLCRCICGREKIVTAHDLKSGGVKSCGCRQYEKNRNIADISGRRFGRLVALYPTERRDGRGSVYWRCRCDCGNTANITEASLTHGNARSCGCLKAENQQKLPEQLHVIDGTCIEILEKRKHRKDNTSGFRGVYQLKDHRYRVDIGFKKHRFYIGIFDTYEEAVQARMDADPEWGKEHPLKFDVAKENGELVVR